MFISDILNESRVFVDHDPRQVRSKTEALRVLSGLLAPGLESEPGAVEELLLAREGLQSTGIGDGVAIPHASIESAPGRVAALVVCPDGVPFDSVDGQDARIIVGVVGPRQTAGEHLRVLARVSRLLRERPLREALTSSTTPAEAYSLIRERDRELG
jgi:nitrogen PTS system EIIA component